MTAVAHVYFGEEAFVKPGFDQIPQVGFPVSSNGLQESKWKLQLEASEGCNFSSNKSGIVALRGELQVVAIQHSVFSA